MEEYEKKLEEISEKLRAINPVFTNDVLELLYCYIKACKEREETQAMVGDIDLSGIISAMFDKH